MSLLLLASTAGAQTIIHRLPSPVPGHDSGGFGAVLCGLGDVNDDGFDDLLFGSPTESTIHPQAGAVRVVSGKNAALIHVIHGQAANEGFGRAPCALGDVDGDGGADFAVSWWSFTTTPNTGLKYYSGRTGALLDEVFPSDPRQAFAICAAVGDVDADGIGDVAVPALPLDLGTSGEDGIVWVFSGANGELLLEVAGVSLTDESAFGTEVVGAGDVDHDGHADLFVLCGSAYGNGLVRVVSGANGTVLQSFTGDPRTELLRSPMGAAGDWNADGRNDIFLTRYADVPEWWNHAEIEIRSGMDGTLIQVLPPLAPGHSMRSCTNVGDANGDGRDDLALSVLINPNGPDLRSAVQMVAGGSGLPLFGFERELSGQVTILPIAAAGDVSGDGLTDVVCGIPGNDAEALVFAGILLETGEPFCVGGAPGSPCPCGNHAAQEKGSGCINSTGAGARLQGFGVHLHLSDELELLVSSAPPDVPLILLRSNTQGLNPPLFSDGRPCLWMPWVAQVSRTNAAGTCRLLEHPGLGHYGTTLYQAWYRDSVRTGPCGSGNNFTQAVRVRAE